MSAESDVLMKLRPVSFYYRLELDETQLRQYGLVAEEVAEVAPDGHEVVPRARVGAPDRAVCNLRGARAIPFGYKKAIG